MTPTVRPLREDELGQRWELGRLAFGGPDEAPAASLRQVDGVTRIGAFDGAGRLIGSITDLPHEHWWGGLERAQDRSGQPFMHRPVDVVRAVGTRGWPAHVRGRVAFRLTDALAPWNDGAWELAIGDGAGTLTRATAEPDLTLDVRGFAVLYCGASTGRAAAQAGLAGGNADPAALDLLSSGPRAQLLDYF